jgi:Polymerase beta, Nucleotidyltransferase
MTDQATRRRFTAALDALIAQVQQDRSVLAAILCGSLSHDTVWARSDIDLVLVTIDDRKVESADVALYADGINVHAHLMPRTEFRRTVEGSAHNSFGHSFLAKGRLLYSHDPTIADLCARLQVMGERDRAIQRLRAGTAALPSIDKAHKWFLTRRDLDYTALWILYGVTALARVEVIEAGLLADREVIPQALTLNPSFFTIVYTDLLNRPKTIASVQAALDAIDGYVARRAASLFAPIVDHLREAGEPRGCRELEHHFKKTFDVDCVVTACEYLADQGLIAKASVPVHLTKRSSIEVQELAFVYLSKPPDAF